MSLLSQRHDVVSSVLRCESRVRDPSDVCEWLSVDSWFPSGVKGRERWRRRIAWAQRKRKDSVTRLGVFLVWFFSFK